MTKFDNHLKEHIQYTKEVEDINLGLIVSDGLLKLTHTDGLLQLSPCTLIF